MEMSDREGAVAWTKLQLVDVLKTLQEIEATVTRSELDILKMAEHLHELANSESADYSNSSEGGDVSPEILGRAWKAGLFESEGRKSETSDYEKELQRVLLSSETSATHFDALSLYATSLINRGEPLPIELRSFVTGILNGDVKSPSRRAGVPIHPSRDKLLYALLVDIKDRYGIPATRAKNEPERVSACDILREAMPNRTDLTKSYSTIERIYLAGNRLPDE